MMNSTEPYALASEQKEKGSFMSRFNSRRPDKETTGTFQDNMSAPQPLPRKEMENLTPNPTPVHRQNVQNVQNERDVNIFTAGLTIEGNVISETDIIIRGTVKGNITSRSDIELSGNVTGDVQGKNIRINGGSIRGNILAGESLSIDSSRIIGNLSAVQARINNHIDGDIAIQGTLMLQREANIQGNITAAGLSVEEGATMNGQITITREHKEPLTVPQDRTHTSATGKSSSSVKPSAEPVPVPDGRLPLEKEHPGEDKK